MTDLSQRDRTLAAIAPLLLCLVAAVGLYRSHTIAQSSWSGASFGMFATFESESTRFFRVSVDTPDGVEHPDLIPGAVEPAIARAALRARVVPTEAEVQRVAERILGEHADATRVSVELWTVDFHRDGPRMEASERAVVVEVER